MKFLIFVFSFVPFLVSNAQVVGGKFGKYDFINYNSNEIRLPSHDTSSLNCFFEKLNLVISQHNGNVNILHIGGSHVQADMFSNRVRLDLDSISGGMKSSRGVIFPFKVAKTNNPNNYSVRSKGVWTACKNVSREKTTRLGMTGMSVTTKDANAEISISLNPKDSINRRWTFNSLRVLGYAENGAVQPLLKITDTVLLEGIYDLKTSSYLFSMPYETDSFTIVFKQKDTLTAHSFTLTGFIPANDVDGVVYHSIGVNGAAVPSYLKCEDFERDLQLIKPDLVIFGIGINDAAGSNFSDSVFIRNYSKLIEKIKNVSPSTAFIFITNNDSYKRIKRGKYKVNPNGQVARQAFYSLADKYNGGVWDLFEIMGGLESMEKWEHAGLARHDKIHFTEKGYTLIGDLFYEAFVDAYKKSPFESHFANWTNKFQFIRNGWRP